MSRAVGKVDAVVSNAALVEQVPLSAALRPRVRPERQSTAVPRAEAAADDGSQGIDHPRVLGHAGHGPGRPLSLRGTKAALRSYSRTWGGGVQGQRHPRERAKPGVVDTPMLDSPASTPKQAAAIRQGYTAYTPRLKLARPEGLAAAAFFLIWDDVAGAAPLARVGSRYSHDIDLFHDRELAMQQAVTEDTALLEQHRFEIEWTRRFPTICTAIVRSDNDGTLLE